MKSRFGLPTLLKSSSERSVVAGIGLLMVAMGKHYHWEHVEGIFLEVYEQDLAKITGNHLPTLEYWRNDIEAHRHSRTVGQLIILLHGITCLQ